MKKLALLCAIAYAAGLNGEESTTRDQAHHELLGKVKKLNTDIEMYVGAGTSAAGEPLFFAMEKLTDKNYPIWKNYADSLVAGGIVRKLHAASFCNRQNIRDQFKAAGDTFALELMDKMCPNQKRFNVLFREGGMGVGIAGFHNILSAYQNRKPVYVAYCSTQPITKPFEPKITINKAITLKEFDEAYPNIIISVGVQLDTLGPITTEHRGIFKNPFSEIRGGYRNIGLQLHGWAGTVEEQILHKKYITIFPAPAAAQILYRAVKPGDMYIGIDSDPYPYDDEYTAEIAEKFPPINHELLGITKAPSSTGIGEIMHIFDSKVLSKYYIGK